MHAEVAFSSADNRELPQVPSVTLCWLNLVLHQCSLVWYGEKKRLHCLRPFLLVEFIVEEEEGVG